LSGKLGLPDVEPKAVAASIRSHVPACRFGSPVEIAKATVFLAYDESAFTIGSEVVIDGGMSTL
jgi:NAD(P)-dependent dehydrogenase (short-subunit alcohol dehydrogenase family)